MLNKTKVDIQSIKSLKPKQIIIGCVGCCVRLAFREGKYTGLEHIAEAHSVLPLIPKFTAEPTRVSHALRSPRC